MISLILKDEKLSERMNSSKSMSHLQYDFQSVSFFNRLRPAFYFHFR